MTDFQMITANIVFTGHSIAWSVVPLEDEETLHMNAELTATTGPGARLKLSLRRRTKFTEEAFKALQTKALQQCEVNREKKDLGPIGINLTYEVDDKAPAKTLIRAMMRDGLFPKPKEEDILNILHITGNKDGLQVTTKISPGIRLEEGQEIDGKPNVIILDFNFEVQSPNVDDHVKNIKNLHDIVQESKRLAEAICGSI